MRRSPLLAVAGALALALSLAACGDDDTTSPPTSSDGGPMGPGGALTVGAEDALRFAPDSYEVPSGEVTITLENEGSIEHTLLIRGVDFDKLAVSGSTKTDTGTVELEPGEYELYCDIAGHEAAGMVADLVVE